MLAQDACVWAPRWSAKHSRRYGWREAQAQAARTRERQDSRAMRYKVCLSSIDTEHLQHLSFARIARRLHAICGLRTSHCILSYRRVNSSQYKNFKLTIT